MLNFLCLFSLLSGWINSTGRLFERKEAIIISFHMIIYSLQYLQNIDTFCYMLIMIAYFGILFQAGSQHDGQKRR
jgi:hypothetical protein